MDNIQGIYKGINYSIYAMNFLAIIGSVFTYVIFFKKVFRKNTIGFYCRSLAFCDLFIIYNLIVGIAQIVMNNFTLVENNNWLCRTISYISPVFSSMSGWILVAFSLDQLINVSMTKRFAFFKKRWFQYSVLFGLFTFHCLFYVPNFLYSESKNIKINVNVNYTICGNKSLVLPIALLVESSILPLITLLMLTSLIVRYLTKSRNKTFNVEMSNFSFSSNHIMQQKRAKDMKFAFNLVILNVMHIFLTSPAIIVSAIQFTNLEVYLIVYVISHFFFSLNFALHFWIHFCVNSVFRKEFLTLIRIKKS